MSRSRSILQVVLIVLVLAAAGGGAMALVKLRQSPQRIERPVLGPLVEVEEVRSQDVRLEIVGQGEVNPRISVELAPQVTGRVVEVSPSMVSGGRFRAGTPLFAIDARDYELAAERGRASVAGAETLLERELAESAAARAEWDEVHPGEEAPPLLVREPQVREARAQLAAAKADLASAELHLERTRVSLAFDGLVVEESVDPGQLVVSGQRVATVYGTGAVEIRVPLDDGELAWFDLPGRAGVEPGPPAAVSTDFAGARHTWRGRVDRLEGRVDPRSRMVHVVVVVENPFDGGNGRPPLLPGTFVDVVIEGRTLPDVVVVPRHALREGDRVWVVDDDGVLRIRDVRVLRRERERVLVGSGLHGGERVVKSTLDVVTDGMQVRCAGASPAEGGGDA